MMKTCGLLGCVVTAVLFALTTGCGSSDDKGTTPTAGTGGLESTGGKAAGGGGSSATSDAGQAGTSGTSDGGAPTTGGGGAGGSGGSSAGSAGTGGAPPVTPTFKSLPAGIQLTLAPESAPGLALATTSITQETTTTLFYTEWLGELYNETDEPQCLIQVSGDFQDASGVSVIKFDTYAYGEPYKIGTSKLASSCIPPHESMPVWANDLPMEALAIASIKKLVLEVTPFQTTGAIPHPSTPTIGALTKTYSTTFKRWQISGTATATANIYNASITFWGKSGDFYVDNQKVYHLEDLLMGTSWAFDTMPVGGLETATLTSVLPLVTFIDGLQGASASIHTLDPQNAAIVRKRNDALTVWQGAADLRARYRNVAK
jgi:hypothetical protein